MRSEENRSVPNSFGYQIGRTLGGDFASQFGEAFIQGLFRRNPTSTAQINNSNAQPRIVRASASVVRNAASPAV